MRVGIYNTYMELRYLGDMSFAYRIGIINGLPYMPMVPATWEEFEALPHIILTSPEECIVRQVDDMLSTQDDWYNYVKELDDGLIQPPFDAVGNYLKRELVTAVTHLPAVDTPEPPDTTTVDLFTDDTDNETL